MGAGESLIASSAGVRVSRQMIFKLPAVRIEQIFRGAFRGDAIPGQGAYSLAATLLEVPTTPKRAIEIAFQIHAYAFTAALHAAESDESEETEARTSIFD